MRGRAGEDRWPLAAGRCGESRGGTCVAVVGFLGKFPERLFYRVLRVRASTRGEGMGSFHRQFPRTVDGR